MSLRIKCKGGEEKNRDAEIEKETFRRQRHHQCSLTTVSGGWSVAPRRKCVCRAALGLNKFARADHHDILFSRISWWSARANLFRPSAARHTHFLRGATLHPPLTVLWHCLLACVMNLRLNKMHVRQDRTFQAQTDLHLQLQCLCKMHRCVELWSIECVRDKLRDTDGDYVCFFFACAYTVDKKEEEEGERREKEQKTCHDSSIGSCVRASVTEARVTVYVCVHMPREWVCERKDVHAYCSKLLAAQQKKRLRLGWIEDLTVLP